jgi:hypothetical protein
MCAVKPTIFSLWDVRHKVFAYLEVLKKLYTFVLSV